MYNLTGIYWIKDEARYLPEYLEFHLLQGFDHFIFYDNGSTDNLEEIIAPYIEAGLVEIRKYPDYDVGAKNMWLMNHCIDEQKGKSKWIHFHAPDERLFSPSGESILDILKEFEDFGGLSVGWELMNYNYHITRQDGLIIENFTKYVTDTYQRIKTLIQPEYAVSHIGTPHQFRYVAGKFAVDENKRMVLGDASPYRDYSRDRIKLHHYFTMSKQEFDEKMNKGLLDHAHTENIKRPSADYDWEFSVREPFYDNFDLLKFVEPVREAIKNRYIGREHLLQYVNH